jgi:hypothetical protein
MALLVYSDRCQYSHEILKYIQGQPALSPIIRFWNVTMQGVPSQKITRVPTLVTDQGKMLVGSEVKVWLESMVPCDFESWDSGGICQNLDGSETPGGIFELDRYGTSLQPKMTPELEERINSNPTQAYQKRSAT